MPLVSCTNDCYSTFKPEYYYVGIMMYILKCIEFYIMDNDMTHNY